MVTNYSSTSTTLSRSQSSNADIVGWTFRAVKMEAGKRIKFGIDRDAAHANDRCSPAASGEPAKPACPPWARNWLMPSKREEVTLKLRRINRNRCTKSSLPEQHFSDGRKPYQRSEGDIPRRCFGAVDVCDMPDKSNCGRTRLHDKPIAIPLEAFSVSNVVNRTLGRITLLPGRAFLGG